MNDRDGGKRSARDWATVRRKVLIVMAVVFVFDPRGWGLIWRGWTAAGEVIKKREEYREQRERRAALAQVNRYLRTPEGQEWIIYQRQGLVKPGEEVGQVWSAAAPLPAPQSWRERCRAWKAKWEQCLLAWVRAGKIRLWLIVRGPFRSTEDLANMETGRNARPKSGSNKPIP